MRLWTGLKIAIVLGGVVVIILAALIAVTDVNSFKPQIAAAIEAQTGRKIVFGGDIELSLGRTTTLTINDVQLANVAGGSRPNMLQVAEATAEVDAWELRRGEIVIQRLVLRGVDVLVEIDEQGRSNFDFTSAVPVTLDTAAPVIPDPVIPDPVSPDPVSPDNDGGDGRKFMLQRVGDVDVLDAKVTIHDARNGQTQQLSLERFQLRDANTESLVRISALGRLGAGETALPFDVEGQVGRLAALVARDIPYPLDLRGTVDGVALSAAGTIADPFAKTGIALKVDVSAKNLSTLAHVLGKEMRPVGSVRLIASLTGTAQKFSLGDLSFVLEDSRLSGDLSVDLSGPRLNLTGSLSANRLNITPWLPIFLPREKGRLVNDYPISFKGLQGFDGKLSITANTLVAADLLFRDAAGSFGLKNGRLRLSRASARFDGREFTGDLAVNSRANPPAVSLKLASRDFDIGRVLARMVDDEFIHGTGGLDFALEGRGGSLAEIVGSSNGHARILMDAGEVKTGKLGLLVGGISEILPGLGSDDAGWTAINCVAGDFDLHDGLATSRVALLDSEILRLVGEGQIDLDQNSIEFYVVPSAKNPTLNVAVPVNMSGPLGDPSISLDELSLLRRLGGLVGAVIFPPAAILTLGSLGNSDNPCLDAVKSAAAPTSSEPDEPGPADYSGHPEAELPPEAGTSGANRLIDAVRQLLPLRGDET